MSIDTLQDKIRTMKNPTVLGLSPTPGLIPDFLKEESGDLPEALEKFSLGLLDALKDLIPAVQVQAACFAIHGPRGLEVMDKVLAAAKDMGYYVILDTDFSGPPQIAEAVAETYYAAFPGDAMTLNGYLGSDSVKPFLPQCKKTGKSLFVTVKSPNRSGTEIQDLLTGGRLVHTAMADLVSRWGQDLYGRYGYSQVAAIVGAPYADAIRTLRAKYNRVFFLVTGYDSQSGNAKGASCAFDRMGLGAAVCAGRYILGAWQAEGLDPRDFALHARAAAERMKKNLAKYILVM